MCRQHKNQYSAIPTPTASTTILLITFSLSLQGMKRTRDEMSEGDLAQKVLILEHDSEREFVKITKRHDLFNAIARADVETIKKMKLSAKELAHIVQDSGITPLMAAAMHGHWDVAAHLVLSNTDAVNKQNESGSTALHHAVAQGNLAVVTVLCSLGSLKLDIPDKLGNTALSLAVQRVYEPPYTPRDHF